MVHGQTYVDGVRMSFDRMTGAVERLSLQRSHMSKAPSNNYATLFGGASVWDDVMRTLHDAIWENFHQYGKEVGFMLMDLNAGKGMCYNADWHTYSACSIKAPYITSVYQDVWGDHSASDFGMYSNVYWALSVLDNGSYFDIRNTYGNDVYASWLEKLQLDPSRAYTGYFTWYSPCELATQWLAINDHMKTSRAGGELWDVTRLS